LEEKCLSKDYVNNRTKLTWECSEGHTWEAIPANIKGLNRWCPHCNDSVGEKLLKAYLEKIFKKSFDKVKPSWLTNDRGNKMELDGYAEELMIAFEHHGQHHYQFKKSFYRNKSEFKQRQDDDILKEAICSINGVKLIIIPEIYTLTPIDELTKTLKKEFKRLKIIPPKSWEKIEIPISSSYNSVYLDKLKDIAKEKGGKLISNSYVNSSSKLAFECSKGHRWFTKPNKIISAGRWCPVCGKLSSSKSRIKYSKKELDEIAKGKGGKCLSKKI
jgi:hypothetical protein